MEIYICPICHQPALRVLAEVYIIARIFHIFAGPKRGRPTPGFSIFIRSDGGRKGGTFVSLDQILVPTQSLGTEG